MSMRLLSGNREVSRMLRLCLKDFRLNKSIIILLTAVIFFFLFPIAFVIEMQVPEPTLFVVLILFVLIYTDEKHDTETLICSLPVKRSTIVYSRYVSALVTVLTGLVLTLLLTLVVKGLWPRGLPLPETAWNYKNWVFFLSPVVLFISCCFPCYFKFGYGRGVGFGLLFTTGAALLFACLLYVAAAFESGTPAALPSPLGLKKYFIFIAGALDRSLTVFGERDFFIFISLSFTVIVIISMQLSAAFYKRRDL